MMWMNESSDDQLMLILVMEEILRILANSPIHVAVMFYETEKTSSQARTKVWFLVTDLSTIVSLSEEQHESKKF